MVSFALARPAVVQAAGTRHKTGRRHHAVYLGGPSHHAELLMDADSGKILYAENETLSWPPASMAKMMLLLVAEDQIRAGRVSYDDPVQISALAASTRGSHIGLREGHVYTLGELMKAAIVKSANDAAVAVAEKIAGSVDACVRMMNAKAHELRMEDTHYGTVDGLPPIPDHDVDRTTAFDLAILARSIIHNTNLLRWSSLETAPFDGGRIMLHNTNHLVGHLEGCDGLKTGFTIQAGFNLTATAKRNDLRLISVLLGAPSNPQRFSQSAKLLEWGFNNYTKVHLVNRGQALPVQVQVESGPTIQPVAESDIALVVPKKEASDVKLQYSVPQVVQGPVTSGEPIGQVIALNGTQVMAKVDAICPVAVGGAPTSINPVVVSGAPASGNPVVVSGGSSVR